GHGMAPMRLCGGTVPWPKAQAGRAAYRSGFVLPDHNAELKITFLERQAQFGGFGLLGCAGVPLALILSNTGQRCDIDPVSLPNQNTHPPLQHRPRAHPEPEDPPAMQLRNSPTRWGLVSQLLHWAIVALIAWLAWLGLTMVDMPPTPAKINAYALHKSLGLTL